MKKSKYQARKVGKMILIVALCLLVCTLVFIVILIAWSPGELQSFLDENGDVLVGSISERNFVTINGAEQGMIIRGMDTSNPVLLFLHGGPGMPQFFLEERYPTGLDEHFTVVWWEQRGGGLSFDSGMQADTTTVEQLIADTIAVTNYLRERFEQDRIFLMGHSWGTFIGIQVAAREPELFHAYIAVAQISSQIESEKLAYEFMLEQFREMESVRMVRRLEAYPILEHKDSLHLYLSSSLRDEAMHRLGVGTMRNMDSVISGIFLPFMQSRAYTLGEKINMWRARHFLINYTELRNQMFAIDLTEKITYLELPVYFLHGTYLCTR